MFNQTNQTDYSGEVPLYLQILASICYIIAMILGIGGNILVLIVVFYHQRVKSVTSFFIINLAISDLIFALLCIPSTYIAAYMVQYWPFSAFSCIFFNYMQTVSVTLTVYTLIWITFDKYWAFVKPFKLRMSIRICKYLILVSWLLSLFVSLPIAFFTKLTHHSQETIDRPDCVELWPDNLSSTSEIYNISLLLIQYLIPLVILSYCYIRIYFVLMRTKPSPDTVNLRDERVIKSKRRLVKTSFVLVIGFILAWTPLQFLNIFKFFKPNIIELDFFPQVFFVCHLFAVSSSYINPFIYAFTMKAFRYGFKSILLCKFKQFQSLKNNDEYYTTTKQ